jgi:molybdate-binding protein
VIVRCLQRSQGLLVSNAVCDTLNEPLHNALPQLITSQTLRWAMRQHDSGTERLLEDLCSTYARLGAGLCVSTHCNSEHSAAAAVNTGRADICCGVQSTARDFGLPYLPVAEVSLDLVMSRKTYFRTLVQDFIKRMLDSDAHELAADLGGYTILPGAQLVTID